jgi:hypothetical protein
VTNYCSGPCCAPLSSIAAPAFSQVPQPNAHLPPNSNLKKQEARLFFVINTAIAEDGSVPAACSRITEALQQFAQPPFTIQRLCELLADPCRHYVSRQKLQAAVEKLCSVSSTTVRNTIII